MFANVARLERGDPRLRQGVARTRKAENVATSGEDKEYNAGAKAQSASALNAPPEQMLVSPLGLPLRRQP